MNDGKGDVWVEAGFTELARSGVEGVRVEVLAKNLGVTKGGFYRRFADRAALLDAMLERWREGRAASIAQQTSLDGQEPRERLKAVGQLTNVRLDVLEELRNVLVAGEDEDLATLAGEISQHQRRCLGPRNVEIHEHVVQDQRQHDSAASVGGNQRQSQRQE